MSKSKFYEVIFSFIIFPPVFSMKQCKVSEITLKNMFLSQQKYIFVKIFSEICLRKKCNVSNRNVSNQHSCNLFKNSATHYILHIVSI